MDGQRVPLAFEHNILITLHETGHAETKPVSSVVGSVTDNDLLEDATRGVDSVYHVAGKISYGTFPDFTGMYNVNVEGIFFISNSQM